MRQLPPKKTAHPLPPQGQNAHQPAKRAQPKAKQQKQPIPQQSKRRPRMRPQHRQQPARPPKPHRKKIRPAPLAEKRPKPQNPIRLPRRPTRQYPLPQARLRKRLLPLSRPRPTLRARLLQRHKMLSMPPHKSKKTVRPARAAARQRKNRRQQRPMTSQATMPPKNPGKQCRNRSQAPHRTFRHRHSLPPARPRPEAAEGVEGAGAATGKKK